MVVETQVGLEVLGKEELLCCPDLIEELCEKLEVLEDFRNLVALDCLARVTAIGELLDHA